MFDWFGQNSKNRFIREDGDNRMATVGERIKAYLTEEGLKQIKIAEKVGIANDKFNLGMNGKRKIPLDEYVKICEVLGVPFDTFIKSKDELEDSTEETS